MITIPINPAANLPKPREMDQVIVQWLGCVLMRIDDPGYLEIGSNLDLEFDEVPKLSHEEAERLEEAMKAESSGGAE